MSSQGHYTPAFLVGAGCWTAGSILAATLGSPGLQLFAAVSCSAIAGLLIYLGVARPASRQAKVMRVHRQYLEDLVNNVPSQLPPCSGTSGEHVEWEATCGRIATLVDQLRMDGEEQSHEIANRTRNVTTTIDKMAVATNDVSVNIKSVATSVEQMTDSINEVARSAERSAQVAERAAELTAVTDEKVGALGQAANEIGKVTEVIQGIAEQTNLLALNATIEAARAGESGKGFAVVATEVKELAKQTANATKDIRSRIEGIQGSTGEAVNAIKEITDVINNVHEVSRTIASAVEEQSITTRQIAVDVSRTATAAETVAEGVSQTASTARDINLRLGDDIADLDNETLEPAETLV